MTTALLHPQRIRELMRESLLQDDDDPSEGIEVKGVLHDTQLHRTRLESHREEITEMLGELPNVFKRSGGGGMSFLEACFDKHGNHWGEHVNIEELLLLGLGLSLVEFLFPREMWPALPGSMPYFIVND